MVVHHAQQQQQQQQQQSLLRQQQQHQIRKAANEPASSRPPSPPKGAQPSQQQQQHQPPQSSSSTPRLAKKTGSQQSVLPPAGSTPQHHSIIKKRLMQSELLRSASNRLASRYPLRSVMSDVLPGASSTLPAQPTQPAADFPPKRSLTVRILQPSELVVWKNQFQATESGSDSWTNSLRSRKHWRESEEWKKKKARIISKMRAMSKLNLALVLSRMMTIEKLPERVLVNIFTYLHPKQILKAGQVCKQWRKLTQLPDLWRVVSFRPNYGGLQVTHLDHFMHLLGSLFSDLRVSELATDLITPHVLHEISNRCPKLDNLTLDFSTAMQLHDFTDLQSFPSRLRTLVLCLSENIFLEGFLRKVYTFISSVQVLHIVGTYEKVEDEEEEVYETVNVHKLKQFLPNLRVVNLWGVPFVTDEHVDSISSNCAHLESLCVNYCTKVTGSCLKVTLQRCKKLRSLFLANTQLDNKTIQTIEWERTRIEELDVRGTELTAETLVSVLTRLPYLRWLDVSFLEHFSDQVLDTWMSSGQVQNLRYINLDTCDSLNENSVAEFVTRYGMQLEGLNLGGHHKLLEYFWMNMIPKLRNIRVLVMGIAEDCCAKVVAKIHVDQFIDCVAQNCPHLTRLEIRWDDDTLRFSDKSSKFIDVLRMKCLKLHSIVLSDGQYYELVRANFERADRMSVVRTTEMCRTGFLHCSRYYNQLVFN